MKKYNCLIIDDDPLIGWMLEMLMSEAGFSVTKKYTGRKALELLDSVPYDYDLVFLDTNLPDADSFDILKEIRERDTAAYVVIMTASPSCENRRKSYKGQAGYLLEKPFGIREVKAVVNRFLARSGNGSGKLSSKIAFRLQRKQDGNPGKVCPL